MMNYKLYDRTWITFLQSQSNLIYSKCVCVCVFIHIDWTDPREVYKMICESESIFIIPKVQQLLDTEDDIFNHFGFGE